MGNPATVEELYQPLPEVPHEICMVNPDDDHSKDKDKHDKHDDKHDNHRRLAAAAAALPEAPRR